MIFGRFHRFTDQFLSIMKANRFPVFQSLISVDWDGFTLVLATFLLVSARLPKAKKQFVLWVLCKQSEGADRVWT
jgi:hypothetical protein